jgi:hypothetical protein
LLSDDDENAGKKMRTKKKEFAVIAIFRSIFATMANGRPGRWRLPGSQAGWHGRAAALHASKVWN